MEGQEFAEGDTHQVIKAVYLWVQLHESPEAFDDLSIESEGVEDICIRLWHKSLEERL